MDFDSALEYWQQDQRVSGKSSETTRTWLSYLRRFAVFCEPMRATHFEVRQWLDLNGHWSPACQKSARSALSSFYRLMLVEGWVEVDPMLRVPAFPQRRRVQPVACEASVGAGLGCPDDAVRWMVALAAFAGLRRAEIARVQVRDLCDTGVLVQGKGDRERWVPLPGWLFAELATAGPGWVFPGRFGGHVHPATVQRRVREATGFAPHALRRRFATRVYESGEDLLALQHLLGHASPATTELYVSLSRDRLRRAGGAAA